ncbi:PKD domain-containing protein [Desulfogranum japonicum]|uniref:PKD domain-containing protein n=1 Tax=Desulfogranum japonicum TaxID=231447 RepID=UPI00040BC41E|nr:PKD domain-containing protein [Desulfogranum japonicum]
MGIMRYIILLLICIAPLHVFAATERTVKIDVSYTHPENFSLTHTGYKLYKNGQEVCTTNITTSPMTCSFSTENGTFEFSIAATYSDGSESPQSPYLSFTISDTSSTEAPADATATGGSHKICYTIDDQSISQDIVGYRMYLNDYQLCDIASPSSSTLCCYADPLPTTMTFAVSHYDSAGIESDKSNFLTLNPAEFTNLFQTTALTFTWEYIDGETNAGGFQVYYNNSVLCETTVSTARTITCEVSSLATENEFKIAAIDSAGTATLFSNLIVYSDGTSSTTETTPPDTTTATLQALISATPNSGTAPLTVSFDATNSTGNISSYSWNFGDGSSGSGSTVSHAYSSVGIYTASLTVTDTSSSSQTADVEITVSESTASSTEQPVAVISSSTALGEAPLSVNFDGTSSTGGSPLIFAWEFGDGSIGNGSLTSHTFSTAGSYTTVLQVTDSEGLSNSASTPVLVTEPETINATPTAVISATPASGETPLAVTFNGSGSTDTDGSITSYTWNFGDGSTGSGATVSHIYTAEGLYTATLQVRDNNGALSNTSSKTITAIKPVSNTSLIYEVGEVEVATDWIKVQLESSFEAPIIIASPPTRNNDDPVFVRIQNLSADSFEIKLQEWDYLDGTHPNEFVSYIVAEQGVITLSNGSNLEIGQFIGSTTAKAVSFEQAFTDTPIVLTSILSSNDQTPVIDRLENISNKGFTYTLDPGSMDTDGHKEETVGYIAWTQGSGSESGMNYESVLVPRVTQKDKTINFNTQFVDLPFIFAAIQNKNSENSSVVRMYDLTATGAKLSLSEENPTATKITLIKEDVGYIAIGATNIQGPSATEAIADSSTNLFTFSWDYSGNETEIAGFRIYMNNVLLCETNISSERTLECPAEIIQDTMIFSVTGILTDGTETAPSTILAIDGASLPF